MSNTEIQMILNSLKRSSFRASFHLDTYCRKYLQQHGLSQTLVQGQTFLNERLAPAKPKKDGKQTPTKGHPVFIAQHATASCCRSCLYKWHNIPKGKALTTEQKTDILNIIKAWIIQEYGGDPPSSPAQSVLF